MLLTAAVACSLWFALPTVGAASNNVGCCGVDSSAHVGVTRFQVWGVRQWRYWLGEPAPSDTLLDWGDVPYDAGGQAFYVKFFVPGDWCGSAWVLAGNAAGFSCNSPFVLVNPAAFVQPPWQLNSSGVLYHVGPPAPR